MHDSQNHLFAAGWIDSSEEDDVAPVVDRAQARREQASTVSTIRIARNRLERADQAAIVDEPLGAAPSLDRVPPMSSRSYRARRDSRIVMSPRLPVTRVRLVGQWFEFLELARQVRHQSLLTEVQLRLIQDPPSARAASAPVEGSSELNAEP